MTTSKGTDQAGGTGQAQGFGIYGNRLYTSTQVLCCAVMETGRAGWECRQALFTWKQPQKGKESLPLRATIPQRKTGVTG